MTQRTPWILLFFLVCSEATGAESMFERSESRTIRAPATVVVCEIDGTEGVCVCYRKMCYRRDTTRWTGFYTQEAQKAIRSRSTCTAGLNKCPEVWVSKKMAKAR